MAISAKEVQALRDATGAPMMEVKKALEETSGDFKKAQDYLRKKGQTKAEKKAGRATKEGIIDAYVHGNKIGVLLEVNAETDFVARNEIFKNFVHDVAMHIAAASPLYVSRDEVPKDLIEKEKEIYKEQLKAQNKPENIIEKILEGKIDKYFSEIVLLEQSYIKDDSIKVNDLLTNIIAKLGENIQIRRFCRYQIGE
ncbi:TPA: translation elongation factor Ts [candidate division CPR2 bacterium]|uniref:Elongation factor Ts n=1 Tax=candidate division CPR2 bacterium GW2011_GWC1_41_48 TaxID=1618344 RepID=A0A0G0WCC6_UNCC2|nr:MAG: Elongation factor Ts [candidate division CPR2 bacterium GW2011_GWC2_39_35]KKR27859.1 MAG: Elongation factor Ts [candidate division CPR2 bacterium GW2011_GWD2_39_7]KKR28729.1 MAG: Elongation factor Ts [candidate division CPR2 bacterium GW2011_GWD1_39_7]KKS09697.1 MAG: Elongation factor Ts [candidate division CPR2 bacterium GW2011_GWC1_41_48]OGB61376.1 MAG: translation elongation factor Ts [candidate division CPR2 bacterium GWD1_39_7]OGB71958.1 MAG: translation elongation factor Ts [cand